MFNRTSDQNILFLVFITFSLLQMVGVLGQCYTFLLIGKQKLVVKKWKSANILLNHDHVEGFREIKKAYVQI